MLVLSRCDRFWRKLGCETGGTQTILRALSDCQTDQLSSQKTESSNKQTKAKSSCHALLDRFDQQYSKELGDLWASVRSVLLEPRSWQYGVMLNRFCSVTDTTQILQLQGFSTLLLQKGVTEKHTLPDSGCISECPPSDFCCPTDGASLVTSQHPQSEPSLPPLLQCYVHPSPLRFPSQAHRHGQLKQYYLLNAASLLPVLALNVRDGEKVLDLCAAPGGKALAIMQSANPALLCCNEPDRHRRDRLAKTLESFLPTSLNSGVIVSAEDGRSFGQNEPGVYDKVLVDAPCSNDRSWLYSSSSQQGEQRLRERAMLPTLQAELLKSALLAVRPGGVVVYSTCTLSSYENCSVVRSVLNEFPEAELEDLQEEIAFPLSQYFAFNPYATHRPSPHEPSLQPQRWKESYHHPLGILVLPQPGKTWGPMYLSRIRRRK
ncbi:tRNA (cytosine(34)-C(5))-methyltransferase, mitochondrial isoform X2 [Gouania willdenowi]|uniref:SAM-dependent MTase RsmB/NOP-type domain-containing protein n=1 Tax=Gouania willdenowi TaxID=441366 RepID=A0A8C5EEX5_GOUWI|nr:tRNA (cytosine(34)-C(5))-methyltransferase, mitochondrial isoform X2 [Gouania willdenowi]